MEWRLRFGNENRLTKLVSSILRFFRRWPVRFTEPWAGWPGGQPQTRGLPHLQHSRVCPVNCRFQVDSSWRPKSLVSGESRDNFHPTLQGHKSAKGPSAGRQCGRNTKVSGRWSSVLRAFPKSQLAPGYFHSRYRNLSSPEKLSSANFILLYSFAVWLALMGRRRK